MDTILTIIAVLTAPLPIILFFKIWKMTNDVEKIKEHLVISEYAFKEDKIRRAYLKGETYILKDLLDNMLVDALLNAKLEKHKYHDAEKIISGYEIIYQKFGFEIPENILNLKKENADVVSAFNYG